MTSFLDKPITIEATGRGVFPADMLRHDVASYLNAEEKHTADNLLVIRTIRLHVAKRRFFTPDRWMSLGWAAREINQEETV